MSNRLRLLSAHAAVLIVAALLPPLDAAQVRPKSEPTAVAGLIVDDLLQPPFGLSTDEWRTIAPSAEWKEHRSADPYRRDVADPDFLWCMLARDSTIYGVRREAVFYAFRTVRPLACRVEQVQYRVSGTPQHLADFYAATVAVFAARLGRNNMSEHPERPRVLRGEAWLEAKSWHRGPFTVWTYRTTQAVVVLARHHLLEFPHHTYEVPERLTTYGYSSLDWDVANAIRPRHPEASELLLDHSAIPDQLKVLRSAMALVEAAAKRDGTEDMRGAIAIATGRVLGMLWIEGERPALDRPEYAAFRHLGVECEYNGHGGTWHCGTKLAREFMRQYPHTRWSHLMFMDSLGHDGCNGYGYKAVIEDGISWLRRHPTSEFRPFVTAAVAQGYETWWSLSLAPESEELVTAAEHADGAMRARELAIVWYDRLHRQYPESDEAKRSTTRANQVKIGVDTAQRRFYCVIP